MLIMADFDMQIPEWQIFLFHSIRLKLISLHHFAQNIKKSQPSTVDATRIFTAKWLTEYKESLIGFYNLKNTVDTHTNNIRFFIFICRFSLLIFILLLFPVKKYNNNVFFLKSSFLVNFAKCLITQVVLDRIPKHYTSKGGKLICRRWIHFPWKYNCKDLKVNNKSKVLNLVDLKA